MAHTWIYGKFNFNKKYNIDEVRNFAYDMVLKSVEYKFGLKFSSNLSQTHLKKMNLCDLSAGDYLVYEITDDPLSNECYDIYSGIGFGQQDLLEIQTGRLNDLEGFLADIMQHNMISSIDLYVEDVHGDSRAGMTNYTIKANELCHTMLTAPRIHTEMPNIKVLITK